MTTVLRGERDINTAECETYEYMKARNGAAREEWVFWTQYFSHGIGHVHVNVGEDSVYAGES